ncbi:DUF5627 domain-containing protein [Chitinophaga sp. GCM10012297]|uniref:DUF1735 domain-containing protein n=1 Tax=Chitinophaga chungangae TaxID=2821488 RepID=A0ABS3YJ49_9BACT|nr:DUF5627 domain-containing protein [Chitinophaga chungangae]MBO9154727.1 DUF1735 domain-containing protein [Chitinophaga chungangae]
MKKILMIFAILALGLHACKNFEITHPDFKYTSGFFPYQFPVRTLVLGDYIFDNTNDNNHRFVISAHLGGLYENDKDRTFDIEVDNRLADRLLFTANGDTVRALPVKYYTLGSSKIVIPKGEMHAGVVVQLTDEFFEDPQAIALNYVVPIKLKGSNDVDSILTGQSDNPAADPRQPAQWAVAPKDFAMFGIKFINEFHASYFHYGHSEVKDASNTVLEDTVYENRFLTSNPITRLATTGRQQVSTTIFLRSSVMTGDVTMLLSFNGNNCTISAPTGAGYTITGTGEFKKEAYEWGGKPRNGIVLNYTVSRGGQTYTASDVLVVRDREVVMETYQPVAY